MTWTNITTTTTVSASRAVTLPARFRSEPIKILALHPGTGIGGTLTIWDENGASVQVTRLDANSTRYEAEFYSAVDGFNFSFAADGNGALTPPGVSVYLTSRSAPDPNIVDGSTQTSGPLVAPGLRSRKSMATWTPFGIGSVSSSTTTASVGQLVARMPCEFSRVRVWAANASGAPVTAITKIIAAVSSGLNNWAPSVGDGLTEDETTGWITADADGITVPAASASIGGQTVPSYAASAIFNIKSIPASDGGRPWLFLRHPWAANNIGYRWYEDGDHLFNPADQGGAESRYRRVSNADYSYCGANTAAGTAAIAALGSDNYLTPIFRIDVWSDESGWSNVDLIGGSTMVQTGNNSQFTALAWNRVSNLSAIDLGYNIASYGVSGSNTEHYFAMASESIANSPASHIFYAVYSSNDGGWTQPYVDKMLKRFFTIKAIAADAGKVVIPIITIHDSVGQSATYKAIREAGNAKLRAAGDVIDFGDVLGDPSNRHVFAAGMSPDGVHFTDAARLALIAWAPGKIKALIDRNPAWIA